MAGAVICLAAVTAVTLAALLAAGPAAEASQHAGLGTAAAPKQNLTQVIDSITRWVTGIVASLATLFLTIGGLRYLLAGGDPGEITKAKDTLKYAAVGYGVAVLAPVLVKILQGFVGG